MQNILFQNRTVLWIDLENPTREDLERLSEEYQFNRFTLADNLEPGHLPKFEYEENISYLLIRFYGKEKQHYSNIIREFSHKVGIYFNENVVISIHQKSTDLIERAKKLCLEKNPITEKISFKNIIYYIIKLTLESYKAPSETMMERIDYFENIVFSEKSSKITLKEIFELKREASSAKKILNMMNDALKELTIYNKNSSQIQDLRELNTKSLHLYSQILEDVQNLISIFLSISNQKTNDIMKLLTIFSAFFLPLTFIVGVYGMNFKFMPELEYKYGYPLSLLGMLIIVFFIYLWFKRKRII